jgi:hypothetical protein
MFPPYKMVNSKSRSEICSSAPLENGNEEKISRDPLALRRSRLRHEMAPYTVVLNPDQINVPGGTVTFTSAPANTTVILIQRNELLTQTTSFAPYSLFPAKTTERTFDAAVRKIQQVDRRVADLEVKETADISNTIAGGIAAAGLLAPIGTGTTTGITLSNWYATVYDPRQFGAVAGGAAGANATAFQAAFSAACSAGKAVHIPGGTWPIGSTLTGCTGLMVFGDGFNSILQPTISDGTPVINFPAGSSLFTLRDFTIRSTVNGSNFAAGTASAQQCIGIKATGPNTTRYYISNVHVTGVKTGFDLTGWIITVNNGWADYNEVGLKCTTCNSVDLNFRMEADNQYFQVLNGGGVYFRQFLGEGNNATTIASTVDGGQAVTFDTMYLENAPSPSQTQPFIIIGGSTLVQNVSIINATVYNGGAAAGVDAIKIDQADSVYIGGTFGAGSQRHNVITTANTTNLRYDVTPSLGSWAQDNSGNVAPGFNYWPNRRFDLWNRGWSVGWIVDRGVPSQETSIVRNGKNALRVTCAAGQNQNHSWATIKGPEVVALRGKVLRLGVWMWVPVISAFSETSPTMFPAIYLTSYNGVTTTSNPTLNGYTIPGRWNFLTATNTIQSDATEIRADIWPNNGPNNGTGAEYVVVSSITLTDNAIPYFRQLNDDLIDSPLIYSTGVGGRMVASDSALPVDTLQAFVQGDIVWNNAPAAGGTPGWVCTTGGSPGTWKAMANVAP